MPEKTHAMFCPKQKDTSDMSTLDCTVQCELPTLRACLQRDVANISCSMSFKGMLH